MVGNKSIFEPFQADNFTIESANIFPMTSKIKQDS